VQPCSANDKNSDSERGCDKNILKPRKTQTTLNRTTTRGRNKQQN